MTDERFEEHVVDGSASPIRIRTERERAVTAAILGSFLGAVLAVLGRRS